MKTEHLTMVIAAGLLLFAGLVGAEILAWGVLSEVGEDQGDGWDLIGIGAGTMGGALLLVVGAWLVATIRRLDKQLNERSSDRTTQDDEEG